MFVVVSNKFDKVIDESSFQHYPYEVAVGECKVQDIVSKLESSSVEKLLIDITSIKEYEDAGLWITLTQFINPSNVLILLDSSSKVDNSDFLMMLLDVGIYNFSTNIEELVGFYSVPNSFENALGNLNSDNIEEPIIEEEFMEEEITIEESVIEEPILEEIPIIEEPIVEEPIVNDKFVEEDDDEEEDENKGKKVILWLFLALIAMLVAYYFVVFRGNRNNDVPEEYVSQTLTVKFNSNGAIVEEAEVSCQTVQGVCTVILPEIIKEGYIVLGWSLSPEGTDIMIAGETVELTEDMELFAIFVSPDKAEEIFTATFNLNGATSIGAESLTCLAVDGRCSVTAPTITRANHTIRGWSTSREGTNLINVGSPIELTRDRTYYAITEQQTTTQPPSGGTPTPTERTLTARFMVNGVEREVRTCRGVNSCEITIPNITGANITGWRFGNTTYSTGARVTISNNSDFIAQIAEPPQTRVLTATFVANGSQIGATTLTCTAPQNGSCTVTAPSITRANWSIIGWSTNVNATSGTNPGAQLSLNANTTFNAITERTLTVTFTRHPNNNVNRVVNNFGPVNHNCVIRNTQTSCNIAPPTVPLQNNAGPLRWTLNNNSGTSNPPAVGTDVFSGGNFIMREPNTGTTYFAFAPRNENN